MKEIPISKIPEYVETFLQVRDNLRERAAAELAKHANIEPQDRHTGSEVFTVGTYDSKTGKWIS